MFVILAYDVNCKRVGKVLKICRKYLKHVQKSVFEGRITEAKLKLLKYELKKTIDTEKDTVSIYCMDSVKYALKEQIGAVEVAPHII